MRIRTFYILLFALLATCLYALDRSVVLEHAEHDEQLLGGVAQEHARLCAEYFNRRISAIRAVRTEVDGNSDSKAAKAFREAAVFTSGHVSGIQRLLLLDKQMRRIGEWPDAGSGPDIPDELLRSLAQSALAITPADDLGDAARKAVAACRSA